MTLLDDSRRVMHWLIAPAETAELAEQFIIDAIAVNGGTAPKAIHADHDTCMTSVAPLLVDSASIAATAGPRTTPVPEPHSRL